MALVRGGITVKPHVQRFADACEESTGASSFGTYPDHSPPEGPTQALDIFNHQTANGYRLQDEIADFAIANAKRFGVRYVIKWNPAGRDFIWNIERASEGWRAMATRDHSGHVHITFYASAPDVEPAQPQEVPEVSKIAYPLPTVRAGERRRIPVVAIGGGFGWTKAAITFASTGVQVRRAVVGPNERPIEHLSPAGVESAKHFDGRWWVDLEPGDEWIELDLGTDTPDGALDLYVEASDA